MLYGLDEELSMVLLLLLFHWGGPKTLGTSALEGLLRTPLSPDRERLAQPLEPHGDELPPRPWTDR